MGSSRLIKEFMFIFKIVENLFFEHHYPCSSFAVISKNGDYISYFGEIGKEYIWEATQIMNK
jgi:hypothetical protein